MANEHTETFTPEECMWEQFHKLWSGQVGVPGYIKKEWVQLEYHSFFKLLKQGRQSVISRTL